MVFPVEIIEEILSHCNGRTLLAACEVNPIWNTLVNNITKRKPIWKWCCNEEIPHNELIEYMKKYANPYDPDKWYHIYKNWNSWHNIKAHITFNIDLCPTDVPRITCIAVCSQGNYIAIGSEDGRVRFYNEHWELLLTKRHFASRVTEINFIYDDEKNDYEEKICMLVAYKQQLVLVEYQGIVDELLTLRDVKSHSVFKKFICYEKLGGRIVITKLLKDTLTGENQLEEISFVRIYSPAEVTCLNMWNGVCTFLLDSEVKTINYDKGIPPMTNFEKKAYIKFSSLNLNKDDSKNCRIYRDDIIIGLSKDVGHDSGQFIELFILSGNMEYSKKLFNVWEILQSYITCMFLYGNTFVLGVDAGYVYFYNITSWKHFDIRDYQQKIIVGKHPVIGIDVKESFNLRKFYVTSTFNIHEISGYACYDANCDLK